jgi:Thioredoxin
MRPTAAGPPLACDTHSGTCTVSGAAAARPIGPQARATVLCVSDPICSGCWALEPAWRKLRYRYGDLIEVRQVYGGLLPSWEGFADRGAGITSPAHVRRTVALESALLDVLGIEALHHDDPPGAAAALRAYGSGTLLEFATLMELDRETTAAELAAAGASPRFRGPTEYRVTTGPGASSGGADWENGWA